jgi:lipoate-protein ligase A
LFISELLSPNSELNLTMTTWRFIDSGPNLAASNMASDEELLARAQAGETTPVLRFYTWDPPAVSIGRFQDMKAAVNAEACRQNGFDVVRRITGGRAVLHREELTYSIIARTDDPFFPPSIPGTYRVIAAGLVAGLRHLGLPAEMVSRESGHARFVQKRSKAAACFSSPSWYEILVNSRKIVGSAQRRAAGAFLQHGSILMDYDRVLEATAIPNGCSADVVTSVKRELGREITLDELKKSILKGFSDALGIGFQP